MNIVTSSVADPPLVSGLNNLPFYDNPLTTNLDNPSLIAANMANPTLPEIISNGSFINERPVYDDPFTTNLDLPSLVNANAPTPTLPEILANTRNLKKLKYKKYHKILYEDRYRRNEISMLSPLGPNQPRIYLPPVSIKCSIVRLCDKRSI